VAALAEGGKLARLEGEIFYGAAVPGQELQDNTGTPTARALFGDGDAIGARASTQDIMLGIPGTGAAGGCMGIFMPAADFEAEVVESNGFAVVKFTADGTGATPCIFAVG
jgi:hypothetical protein